MPKPDNIKNKVQKNWSLWEAYAPQLHRFLISKLANREDAQDLMQEAYLRLIRIKKPELVKQPEAYLFRIAANLIGEFYIGKSKAPPKVNIEDISGTGEDGDGGVFAHSLQMKHELKDLEDIFSKMPPLYREVLMLRKSDGLSHAEIAEKLDISKHTVHKYLTRALTECRSRWSER